MKRKLKYPYYEVVIGYRDRAEKTRLTLKEARRFKKQLIKRGEDAHIVKNYRDNDTGYVFSESVR